jgi:hypothetical protein
VSCAPSLHSHIASPLPGNEGDDDDELMELAKRRHVNPNPFSRDPVLRRIKTFKDLGMKTQSLFPLSYS